MPHDSTITHSNQTNPSAKTWLDLYPLTHVPTRKPDDYLTARVDKIKETLEFIKWKIGIRGQLVALAETNGKYCITCGRNLVVPCCGTTCPLIRAGHEWHKYDKPWVYFAKKDVELFEKLNHSVHTYGPEVDKRTVQEWEVTATDLLKRTENPPNRYHTRTMKTNFRGFDKDWTFEGHWGKGPGLEVELAPDEIEPPVHDETHVKQQRGESDAIFTSSLGTSSTFAQKGSMSTVLN